MSMEENYNSSAVQPAPAPVTPVAETKKQSGNKNIIIAILCVLVVGLGCVVAYLLLNNGNVRVQTDGGDAVGESEVEIKSVSVRKDLQDKMSSLLNVNIDYIKEDRLLHHNMYNLTTGLFDNSMNDEMKRNIAISRLNGEYMGSLDEDILKGAYQRARASEPYLGEDEFRRLDYWSAKRVADSYIDIFGKEIQHGTVTTDNSRCPGYTYDSSAQIYYHIFAGCGGGGPYGDTYYIDGYRQKGNMAYVDLYAGSYMFDSDNDTKYTIYNDVYEHQKESKKLTESSTGSGDDITDSNKDQFTHYRFVFEGENEDYHFVEVQKV